MADTEKQAEFAFDLFSDIAPVLALFGDAFARQFASESLTWVDHLIIAMVPLGILTIITGAIRVQGPMIARSFIGRSRENRALAEIELMSSTSKEVCELFNGKSIVRVMGKPKLAQILVFPKEYEKLEDEYEDYDQESCSPEATPQTIEDISCGIHSLKTATSVTCPGGPLMKCVVYQSYGYMIILRAVGLAMRVVRPFRSKKKPTQQVRFNFEKLGPPNLQLGLSSDQYEKRKFTKRHEIIVAAVAAVILQAGLISIATVTVFHDRTRRAISVEPEIYGYPCYVIGTVFLCIGVGICARAIERNTTEFDWQVLEEKERKPLGSDTGECISNHKTAMEHRPPVKDCPRLFWLQKKQEASDQAFDGYTILAGPKWHIITSSRLEDTAWLSPEDRRGQSKQPTGSLQPAISKEPLGISHDAPEDMEATSPTTLPQTHQTAQSDLPWKVLTVFAAGAAGIGFVIQFMGLRALAYPCSIAQLVAILLMALIRALIRRRLGRIPAYCGAFTNYEMDFLATCLVYSREFREYQANHLPEPFPLREKRSKKILRWKVRTAGDAPSLPFRFNVFQTVAQNCQSNTGPKVNESANSTSARADTSREAKKRPMQNPEHDTLPARQTSCRQLIRVRERIGSICSDMCDWQSLASEGALSLASAIEAFMNTFFPDPAVDRTTTRSGKRLSDLKWAIETGGLYSLEQAGERNDYVRIPVRWLGKNDRWQADIRTIEAVLSLWMATIETKEDEIHSGKTKNSPAPISGSLSLRRTKSRYVFCRILGDHFAEENSTLKRDLSWWVDELIAEQSDNPVEEDESRTEPNPNTRDSVADETPVASTWHRSKARNGADLVIGFNGHSTDFDLRSESKESNARELAISDTGLLPTILAQHLFTSFMWTVVEHLPRNCLRQNFAKNSPDVDIEGRHTFDPLEFRETWARPTLRHRELTKLVREIEKLGLGKYSDILLCMIPALSFKDLLPNHTILKLLPPICYPQGWVATAQCYNSLLGTSIRTTNPAEMLGYSIIVAAMDFLHFVCEPYDDFVEPQRALKVEIQTLVESLVSTRFRPILTKLAPLYTIQHRRKPFEKIFTRYSSSDSNQPFFNGEARVLSETEGGVSGQPNTDLLIPDFYMTNLGLSRRFQDLYTILTYETAEPPRKVPHPLRDSLERSLKHTAQVARDVKSLDIFGWSPFHYIALLRDFESFWTLRKLWERQGIPKFHRTLDSFERTPIHLVVAAGSDQIVQDTLEYVEDLEAEDKENILNASGLDQTTLLHLATKNGLYDCVKDILDMGRAQSLTRVDLWGREAVHLAASHGYHDIASRLLQEGAQPYSMDKIGMSPLEYLMKGDVDLKDVQLNDNSGDMQVDRVEDGTPTSERKDCIEPSEISDSLVIRKRKIFVDFALKNVEYRDRSGKTFLHHAIQSTDIETVGKLMNQGYKVDQSDLKGSSALHLAISAGRENLALFMLRNSDTFSVDLSAVDKQGETALMFAAREGYLDLIKRLISGVYFGDPDSKPSKSQAKDQRLPHDTQNTGCDPRTQTSEGRTALQIAISERHHEIVRYLLKLPKLQDEPQTFSGESLLVIACKRALPTDCVLAILQAWPTSINDPDHRYHQTPLSWACEGNNEDIVKLLLDTEEVDVNKQATGWRNYSPLHFAARTDNEKIVGMLLDHTNIKADLKDVNGSTAFDLAIQSRDASVVEAFSVHHAIDAQARLKHMKRIAGDSDEALHGIIRDIFVSLPDETIQDSDLLELVELTENLRCTEPYLAIVQRALTRESTWKGVKPKPMHAAAYLGSLELIEELCKKGAQLTDLDEDGWTCLEYADTYRSKSLEPEVRKFILRENPGDRRSKEQTMPKSLDLSESRKQCTKVDDTQYPGIFNVQVLDPTEEAPAPQTTKTSVLTSTCVPPLTSSRRYFYYEVKILEVSSTKELAIGFCDRRFDRTNLPGWCDISFGYHGDDGKLYINDGYKGHEPTPDFGSRGRFGAGDTVGIGLNLETGEGSVTRNGKELNVGDAFQDAKFTGRKMYPCIGFDTTEDGAGLHFMINLGLSLKTHPFMYKDFYE